MNKIKVLIVDDSALVRKFVSDSLQKDPAIEVVGTAVDPYVAREKILSLQPDVLTLDIEMPRMDGLTFLKILMQHRPMPVVIMSSLTQGGSRIALECLQAGAVEVLGKPSGSHSVGSIGRQLAEKIKAAAMARISKPATQSPNNPGITPIPRTGISLDPRKLILLGASTGGTEALKEVLTRFPREIPGICIVQHIPAYFSKAFADRMNSICQIEVREAAEGDLVRPGLALIAPGDQHLMLKRTGAGYRVSLGRGPMVWHQRPAVDVLFKSAVDCGAGPHTLAGVLTGMGKDGAEGLLHLRKAGAITLGQDEASCVVYGMPRVAAEIGAVQHVVNLSNFADRICELLQRGTNTHSLRQSA